MAGAPRRWPARDMLPTSFGRRSLRLAVLQHEPETGLGAFAPLLEDAPVHYETVATLHAPLPDADDFDGAVALGGSLNVYDPRLLETRRWIRNSVLRAS